MSPFLINFYKGMRLLTAAEKREFPMQTHAQEEEEVVSANEVNTDPRSKQINLPPRRTERSRDRREEGSSKRRKLLEVVVTEECEPSTVSIKLRSPNVWAMTKVKARQLVLEAKSSTESRVDALQGQPNPEVGAELNVEAVGRKKEVPMEKDL